MRLAGEREVLSGFPPPAERIEHARPLLISFRVLGEHRCVVFGIVQCGSKQNDKPIAVAVRQWLQHDSIDDGVDCCGRSDPGSQSDRCEQRDRLGVPP
jgi:hypothetical protein